MTVVKNIADARNNRTKRTRPRMSDDMEPLFQEMNKASVSMKRQFTNARRACRYKAMKMTDPKARKQFELEVMHRVQKIEEYGFEFFPDHYVTDILEELKAMGR